MPFMRKYGVLTVTGTTAIRLPIIKRGVVDFAVGADWTPAAGDVKIAIDAAAPTNVTNLPAAVASGNGAYWEFILTAAELTCKQAIITIVDAATKTVEDQSFIVETYGNASAMYAADLSAANLPSNVTQLLGTAWATPNTAGLPDINVKQIGGTTAPATAGVLDVNLKQILGTVLTETAGLIAAGFKKFFNIATPAGTVNSLPDAVPGAAGGVFIAGSNAATTVNITGNLSGSVGSLAAQAQADVRTATGLASANLDTQLAAIQTAIGNLNNLSALANLFGSAILEIPDAGSVNFPFTLTIRDNEGKLVDLDGTPTVTAFNAAGTDRSANISAVAHPSTGVYTFNYNVTSAATSEGLRIAATGTVSAEARRADFVAAVADFDSVTLLNTINTKLGTPAATVSADIAATKAVADAVKAKTDQLAFTVPNQVDSNVLDWKSATAPAMTGDAFARLGAPAGLTVSADVAAVKADSAAIKLKTDTLPASPADQVTSLAIKAKTDLITTDPALQTTLLAVKAKTDNLPATPADEATSAAIKTKTDNLPSDPADESLIISATDAIMGRIGVPVGASISADVATKPTAVQVDTQLSGAHGAGSWEGGGGGGLTAQQVRDSLKLAASAGAPAADSIDDKLNTMPVDVDAELSLVHGGGPWGGSAGTGIFAVTIQVFETATVTPIEDAAFVILNSAGDDSPIIAQGRTDPLGQAVVNLDAGTYKIRATKSRVAFNPTDTIVVAASGTETIFGTPMPAPAPPAGPDACQVFDWLFQQDDETPVAAGDVEAWATIVRLPMDSGGKLHIGDKVAGIYDETTGYLYWNIVKGAVVLFEVSQIISRAPADGVRATIPDAASVRLETLLP